MHIIRISVKEVLARHCSQCQRTLMPTWNVYADKYIRSLAFCKAQCLDEFALENNVGVTTDNDYILRNVTRAFRPEKGSMPKKKKSALGLESRVSYRGSLFNKNWRCVRCSREMTPSLRPYYVKGHPIDPFCCKTCVQKWCTSLNIIVFFNQEAKGSEDMAKKELYHVILVEKDEKGELVRVVENSDCFRIAGSEEEIAIALALSHSDLFKVEAGHSIQIIKNPITI